MQDTHSPVFLECVAFCIPISNLSRDAQAPVLLARVTLCTSKLSWPLGGLGNDRARRDRSKTIPRAPQSCAETCKKLSSSGRCLQRFPAAVLPLHLEATACRGGGDGQQQCSAVLWGCWVPLLVVAWQKDDVGIRRGEQEPEVCRWAGWLSSLVLLCVWLHQSSCKSGGAPGSVLCATAPAAVRFSRKGQLCRQSCPCALAQLLYSLLSFLSAHPCRAWVQCAPQWVAAPSLGLHGGCWLCMALTATGRTRLIIQGEAAVLAPCTHLLSQPAPS